LDSGGKLLGAAPLAIPRFTNCFEYFIGIHSDVDITGERTGPYGLITAREGNRNRERVTTERHCKRRETFESHRLMNESNVYCLRREIYRRYSMISVFCLRSTFSTEFVISNLQLKRNEVD
jgi:hypothetical protein